jgi:alkylation response protein AidB-like acyl-CoA dehydrogenase
MEFRDSPNEAAFRQEVRTFVERECPPALRTPAHEWGTLSGGYRRADSELMKEWRGKLAERGWIAPAWPKEYGGAGLSVMEQFIFNETMAEERAPAVGGISVGWAGPTIIVYGTDEQKAEHLPPILRGETTWCQLFSEPGAGSDLAAVQTRAVRDGDDYVINGQKIWTSGAHRSDWGILLARTDPDAPKHRGISYFLLNMKTPGITIRPLVNMAGAHDFNEVFFDNVRISRRYLLGEENRGWYIGATTLDFERSSIANSVRQEQTVDELVAYLRAETGASWLPARRRTALGPMLADRAIEARVARLLSYRVISMQNRGEIPNKEASVAKLFSSELEQRIAQTAMAALGMHGQLRSHADLRAPLDGRVPRFYLYASPMTIGGGTSEIQRNIIATRGLGLPRG